ncbi:hypothetical protein AXF42_Ash017654 [Apostasia shenzhenica]|uniref:Myb-like domain-containing protein n=1 Tax=Apostasia shenzhenica TaxID=1088818 RepID=A0A2I0A5F9_9ASPA|nr:hypothetical protein AXF42_Ash017654 [Apostasia shenzhenica]
MTAGGSSAAAIPRKSTPGSPWTDQETAHLIEAYEEKWYSLKRGQLKAQQWEEVAAEIAARCGLSAPSKNGTQCRHKIEKLRKRYRSERLRPVRSSWTFFDRIDRMERGPIPISARPLPPASSDEDEDSGEPHGSNKRSINGILREVVPWGNSRTRKKRTEEDDEDEDDGDDDEEDVEEIGVGGGAGEGLAELAAELTRFGEGYVKLERKRMEMMREMEREWMEMETRRVEMVMDAQRCLVETIAGAFSKKAKNSEDL